MIKTKIIVTLGPSLGRPEVLPKVVKHVNVIRINFSHGNREEWLSGIESVNRIAKALGKDIAFLADLPGPKIRVGTLDAPVLLKKGTEITFSHRKDAENVLPVEYPLFYKDAKRGVTVDIGDGDARLRIIDIRNKGVVCKVLDDGVIKSRKGIALLGTSMSAEAPTKNDFALAKFALKNDFDFLGMSFVKSAEDIRRLRGRGTGAKIIAKIEKREAVENIEEIAQEADGLMVARGDLAMDVKLEHIPEVQRRIINAARRARKPVIVATQLLASMINSPTPTRAEVNDIANAVMGGADCLMLSDETTVGKYPIEAVDYLMSTAGVAERLYIKPGRAKDEKITAVNMAIAFAAADLAEEYKTDCIFIPTQTGTTARIISELRSDATLIALSASQKVRRSLQIYHGLNTLQIKKYDTIDGMLRNVKEIAVKKGVKKYIVVSGSPNKPGGTDTLKYVSL